MPKRDYCYGIYYYVDKTTGKIDYIGLDSHIDIHKRRQMHLMPSRRDAQPFNRILQNNPDRWEYHVGAILPDYEIMRHLEKELIAYYSPRFNFKDGGDSWNKPNFKYSMCKSGIDPYTQKQKYAIKSKDGTQFLKYSFDKSKLETIVSKLNKGEITESDVKKKVYNICKMGKDGNKQRYGIYEKSNKYKDYLIKSCNLKLVEKARDMLNNNLITPMELRQMTNDEFKELI